MTRYDIVTNYRCGDAIEEMEPSENGDWVQWDDVKAAVDPVMEYIRHKRECRKWGDSLGARLYGGLDCNCGLDELAAALRSLASPGQDSARTKIE